MSAILPPAERLWYKHPIDRVEGTWIAIALTWCLIMFFMMVGWHVWGRQSLSTETYRTRPEPFMAKVQAMVDKHTVRTETEEKIPVVKPPPGSDVYLHARLWSFYPILELEKDKTYRLHLTSMDYNHRLLAAAGEHQHPDRARLRARGHRDAEPLRHLLGGVQRILRDRSFRCRPWF